MSTKRKENSVLFSLRELKDLTSDEPERKPRPLKSTKKSGASASFVDDTDSLLADIRDAVGADAEREAERIEKEKRVSAEAEKRRIQETAALERAEIQARVAAERARQRAAAEERAARLQALDGGEDDGEPTVVADVMAAAAAHSGAHSRIGAPAQSFAATGPHAIIATQPGIQIGTGVGPAPQASGSGRGGVFYFSVFGGVCVVCATILGIVLILRPNEPPPAPQPTIQPVVERIVVAPPPPPVAATPPPPVSAAAEIDEADEADAGQPDAEAPKKIAKARKRGRGGKRAAGKRTTAGNSATSDDATKAGGRTKKKLKVSLDDDVLF